MTNICTHWPQHYWATSSLFCFDPSQMACKSVITFFALCFAFNSLLMLHTLFLYNCTALYIAQYAKKKVQHTHIYSCFTIPWNSTQLSEGYLFLRGQKYSKSCALIIFLFIKFSKSKNSEHHVESLDIFIFMFDHQHCTQTKGKAQRPNWKSKNSGHHVDSLIIFSFMFDHQHFAQTKGKV